MPKIIVLVREIHIQPVEIEAENEIDAFRMVTSGEGEEIGESYYYETLGPDTWTVERVKS